ncbi:MAG: transcription antitermination factor NusB [Clostridiaceae bacterium]|nr:transcription antitermination factor NusB [Clostridiaceae bacterium]
MIRREIREKAFMFLFQLEFLKSDGTEQLAGFIEEYEIDQVSSEYFNTLVEGVTSHLSELDDSFIPFLKGWTKERLPRVDLTIIRLAAFEMLHVEDVPDNVAISEAVLLAKRFSTEESRSYINAVLGRLSREKDQVLQKIKEAKELKEKEQNELDQADQADQVEIEQIEKIETSKPDLEVQEEVQEETQK